MCSCLCKCTFGIRESERLVSPWPPQKCNAHNASSRGAPLSFLSLFHFFSLSLSFSRYFYSERFLDTNNTLAPLAARARYISRLRIFTGGSIRSGGMICHSRGRKHIMVLNAAMHQARSFPQKKVQKERKGFFLPPDTIRRKR